MGCTKGEAPEGVSFKAMVSFYFSDWTVCFRYSILYV